jgi:hypothetical protein
VSRTSRQREAEAASFRAAADRLLAGTPLRSVSGKLTVTELITETGLRRDVVYADHQELTDEFRARVKAQGFTPLAMRELAGENIKLKEKLSEVRAELAQERAAGAALRRVVAELSLELQQARDELASSGSVARLPVRER